MIHVAVDISIIDDPAEIAKAGSPFGKPFMRVSTPDGTVELSFNQAVMLAGATRGAALRFVDAGKLPESVLDPRWREAKGTKT